MKPTDEQIEAGRMVLVDATGHGYRPELVRAVYDAMRGADAPDIVPDELVKAGRELLAATDARDTCIAFGEAHAEESERCGLAWASFRKALSLPRRTDADIRADERERCAASCDASADTMDVIANDNSDPNRFSHRLAAAMLREQATLLRSQGDDNGNG